MPKLFKMKTIGGGNLAVHTDFDAGNREFLVSLELKTPHGKCEAVHFGSALKTMLNELHALILLDTSKENIFVHRDKTASIEAMEMFELMGLISDSVSLGQLCSFHER